MAEWAIADGKKVARCVPHTTMNSNSDAKLVDAMQSGIGLVLFFSGKEFPENSTKPNRQSFRSFKTPGEWADSGERVKNHVGILSYPSVLTYATFR
jgi:hypothetical protein